MPMELSERFKERKNSLWKSKPDSRFCYQAFLLN
jgi:hypothetical protein